MELPRTNKPLVLCGSALATILTWGGCPSQKNLHVGSEAESRIHPELLGSCPLFHCPPPQPPAPDTLASIRLCSPVPYIEHPAGLYPGEQAENGIRGAGL